jgi:hypothetical protein
MEQKNGSTPSRKHLNWNERISIDGFLKAGLLEFEIARLLDRDQHTINREVERGHLRLHNRQLQITLRQLGNGPVPVRHVMNDNLHPRKQCCNQGLTHRFFHAFLFFI